MTLPSFACFAVAPCTLARLLRAGSLLLLSGAPEGRPRASWSACHMHQAVQAVSRVAMSTEHQVVNVRVSRREQAGSLDQGFSIMPAAAAAHLSPWHLPLLLRRHSPPAAPAPAAPAAGSPPAAVPPLHLLPPLPPVPLRPCAAAAAAACAAAWAPSWPLQQVEAGWQRGMLS